MNLSVAQVKIILGLILLSATVPQPLLASAATKSCPETLSSLMKRGAVSPADIVYEMSLLEESLDPRILKAWKSYRELHSKGPALVKNRLPMAAVQNILFDLEQESLALRMASLIELVKKSNTKESTVYGSSFENIYKNWVEKNLSDLSQSLDWKDRIHKAAYSPEIDEATLRRLLGEMELEETKILLYGENPLEPSPESLLGRFLKSTKANTVVRSFSKSTQPDGPQGPKRLVVELREKDLPAFKRLIAAHEQHLFHVHTPQQGTLLLSHQNHAGSYATLEEELRLPKRGTTIPLILLNSREGARATQYFKGAMSPEIFNGELILTPWEIPNYCARGGYDSCTHWFGNMPIGDKRVSTYTFPGNVDEHAGGASGKGPQSKKLKAPSSKELQALQEDKDLSDADLALLMRIWKTPGNEQLSHVLGMASFNNRGEFANPGWVAISLLGSTPVDRVPVVFHVLGEGVRELKPDFNTDIHAY